MTETAELIYGYAVVSADAAGPETGAQLLSVAGEGCAPVEVLAGSRVNLAVSRVPAEEFGQDQVEARMSDEAWLSQLALTHFDVVARLFQQGPVLPLRLCTVFRSVESATATLEANGAELAAALTRLTGAAQWSVRVAARKPSRRPADAPSAAQSGTDYLQALARARSEAQTVQTADEQRATELARRLAGLAIAVENTAATEPGVLHAASYLVRDDDAQMFLDAARGFASADATDGLKVDVRGPWPPYSFVPPLPEP